MTEGEYQPVTVSRRIGSSAHDIFEILANPARHREFDGSDSLRGAGSTEVISGVGDVFVMRMHFPHLGDYEMNNHVVEYEQDRRIGWEPEAGRGHPNAAPDNPDPARWGQRWSYELTPDGLRVAVFYTKLQNRLLRPLLDADKPPAPIDIRRAINTLEHAVNDYTHAARLQPLPT